MATEGWINLDPAFSYSNLSMQIGHLVEGATAEDHRTFEPKSQLAVEMDNFAEAIRDNRIPHTPGEEGLQDQKIMAAIYEAASHGTASHITTHRIDAFRGPFHS